MLSLGCATYERKPLALEALATDWSARPLDVEPVIDYFQSLTRSHDPSGAVRFDPADGLTLSEAEAVALHFNPQLRQSRTAAGVPLASAGEAGWWPDPQMQASVLRFVNRGGRPGGFKFDGGSINGVNTGLIGPGGINGAGFERTPPGFRRISGGDYVDDPLIVNASLSITLPISGRLAVEQDVRWAEFSAAWRQVAVAEWSMIVQLRAKWLAYSVTAKKLELSRDYAARIRAVTQSSDRLASVGELKTTDARVLQIELARLRVSIQALETASAQQRLELFAMMGVAPVAPFQLTPDVFVSSVDADVSRQQAMLLAAHPRIQAARADYEFAEESLRLEVREQIPDLNLGPSFSLEEGFSRAGLGIGIPIPLWNRNRQAIAVAFAERDAAAARAEAVVQSSIADMARANTQLKFATERLALLHAELAPLVDKQIEETRTLLDLGEVEVLVLREALRASLEAKLDILDATLARAEAANLLKQMLSPTWVTASAQGRGEDES